MERLTEPAERLSNGVTRMPIIDARKVEEHAMEFYWRLKKYEDTGFTPEDFDKLCRPANQTGRADCEDKQHSGLLEE